MLAQRAGRPKILDSSEDGSEVCMFDNGGHPDAFAIDEQGHCRSPDAENDVCRFYPLDQAAEIMIPEQRDIYAAYAP